jgi:hypothetical protein
MGTGGIQSWPLTYGSIIFSIRKWFTYSHQPPPPPQPPISRGEGGLHSPLTLPLSFLYLFRLPHVFIFHLLPSLSPILGNHLSSPFLSLLTAKTQYLKFETNIPRKETARLQSQFLHSCFRERFIYIFPDWSPYLLQESRWTEHGNI